MWSKLVNNCRVLIVTGFLLVIGPTQSFSKNHTSILELTNSQDYLENYWKIKYRKPPRFSNRTIHSNYNACVRLSFVISTKGRATDIRVSNSRPNNLFNNSALEALETFVWVASEGNQMRQPVKTSLIINFQLEEVAPLPDCAEESSI